MQLKIWSRIEDEEHYLGSSCKDLWSMSIITILMG